MLIIYKKNYQLAEHYIRKRKKIFILFLQVFIVLYVLIELQRRFLSTKELFCLIEERYIKESIYIPPS